MNNYINHHSEEQKSFQTIFAYIIKKGKVTRREIQRDTQYSWGSGSSVVSLLIEKKYVIETIGEDEDGTKNSDKQLRSI